MKMLNLTKQALEEEGALTPSLNPLISSLVNSIPNDTVPIEMKATIAVSQLTTFASQFRRNIFHWDGIEVPINAISFIIAPSGLGKDSTVGAVSRCFKDSYDTILSAREQQEIGRAKHIAIQNGEDESQVDAPEIYEKYMRPLPPIDITPTTGPGLVQHINDIASLDLTAGALYSGEFSDELAYNADMMENIKILSEVYDVGIKQTKYTKSVEHRSKAIDGQAVSALLVGSPGHILYDETTKKKFHVAFMSKLARRSWFCYTPVANPEPDFPDLDQFDDYIDTLQSRADSTVEKTSSLINQVTKFGLDSAGKTIAIGDGVKRLFDRYKRYNHDTVEASINPESTSALIRRHLQWKALKLAGAFAIFDLSDTIEKHHYVQAIQFCEFLDDHMSRFEYDLNKSSHERFADYIHTQVQQDGKAVINVHDLKKNNFITSVSKPKLQELIHLASSYDISGIYSIINDGGAIQYEPIVKTDRINISYKPIDIRELNNVIGSGDSARIRAAKERIGQTTAYGYDSGETTFEDLGNLLTGDYAYSPFRFRDGVRGRDNIIGGTKWLVFDVDDSSISAEEAHFMLSDLKHHIALSSNPSNFYKFRVLIELDSVVELDRLEWKNFYLAVAEDLALRIDPLPQSTIFYSYANRPFFTNLEGEPLKVHPYLVEAKEKEATRIDRSELKDAQKKALLNDEYETFNFAFEARQGEGSRSLIRAAYYAYDLGATPDQVRVLLSDINEYWEHPMPSDRFQLILEQAGRLK